MSRIPKRIREELSEDPRYRVCTLADKNCKGRIQWHHNFIVAGSQIQKPFSIISLCEYHHENARGKYRDIIDWICLSRASELDLRDYPKVYKDWLWKLKYLNKKYGKFKEGSQKGLF